MLDDKELARSTCRIFGHLWQKPVYRARTASAQWDAPGGRLVIERQRACSRCGEVERMRC